MSAVDNLIERSTVRFADRLERSVSGIPETHQVGHCVIVGHAEDGTCFLLVAD
jgi:hypothetical protein